MVIRTESGGLSDHPVVLPPGREVRATYTLVAGVKLETDVDTIDDVSNFLACVFADSVCSAIGLETGSAAQDYIGLYGGDSKLLGESLEYVQRTATKILNAIGADESSSPPA